MGNSNLGFKRVEPLKIDKRPPLVLDKTVLTRGLVGVDRQKVAEMIYHMLVEIAGPNYQWAVNMIYPQMIRNLNGQTDEQVQAKIDRLLNLIDVHRVSLDGLPVRSN